MAELRVTSERDKAKLVAGLAAAPLAAALLAYFGFPIVHWTSQLAHGRSQYSADAPSAFAAGVAIVAVAVVLVGVVPTLLWLLRRGPVKLEHVFIGGFVFGSLPVLIPTGSLAASLRVFLFGSIVGVVSAMVFWVVATAGRRGTT